MFGILATGLVLRIWHASYGLDKGRFEDEQYSLRNIDSIVTGGTLEPASTFYPYPLFNLPPAALVAASQRIYRATGNETFATWKPNGVPRAATYLLCRLVQCLYGVLGLWLVYLLGRELFSSNTGLIAAATLAFLPWHLHASAYFKPDAQVTAMVTLALLWSLRALKRKSPKAYVLAGLAIALAMSSKLTGGVVALPLVVGVLLSVAVWWRGERVPGGWRPPLIGLSLAGGTSALAFVLLNPYWMSYTRWLGSLDRDYAMRAGWHEMTRLQVPGRTLDFLLDEFTLGPMLGGAALLGLAALAIGAWRSGLTQESVLRAVFLSFPMLFTATYAMKTANFKPNNFLPVVPFACLAMAWLLEAGWRSAGRWLPASVARALAVLGLAVLVAVTGTRGWLYAYRTVTPTTEDVARRFVDGGLKANAGRVALAEAMPRSRPRWFRARAWAPDRVAIASLGPLDDLTTLRLARADAEIFPQARLEGEQGEFFRRRVDRLRPHQVRVFEPSPFKTRGPAMVVAKHVWQWQEAPKKLALTTCPSEERCVRGSAESAVGTLISVGLWVPRKRGEIGEASVEYGGEVERLHFGGFRNQGVDFVSERFKTNESDEVLVFRWTTAARRRGKVRARLYRW